MISFFPICLHFYLYWLFCLVKKKIPKIFVYPSRASRVVKKLILFLSLKFINKVVTASNSSFPYKSKKVHDIGHGIDAKLFFQQKKNFGKSELLNVK